jgi:hypothetical protein
MIASSIQSIVLSTFLIVPVVAFAVVTQGCDSLVCENSTVNEHVSPSQDRVATSFVRNCGATTGYATQVTVRWRSSSPEPSDLVFSVDGEREIEVEWLDDLTLSVKCQNCTDDQIFKRVTKQGKVTIKYST